MVITVFEVVAVLETVALFDEIGRSILPLSLPLAIVAIIA